MGQVRKRLGAAEEGERGDSALARGMRAIGICSIANTPAQVRANEAVQRAQVGCAQKGGGEGHCARSISSSIAQAFSNLARVMVLPASRLASAEPLPRIGAATVAGALPCFSASALIRAISVWV